jgi:hypothetical protein
MDHLYLFYVIVFIFFLKVAVVYKAVRIFYTVYFL